MATVASLVAMIAGNTSGYDRTGFLGEWENQDIYQDELRQELVSM